MRTRREINERAVDLGLAVKIVLGNKWQLEKYENDPKTIDIMEEDGYTVVYYKRGEE